MLIPALAVYLLGPHRGFFFTAALVLYAALFHQLYHSGFGQVRPLFHDASVWMSNLITACSMLLGWTLSWLYSAVREESQSALERAFKTLHESESKLLSLIESTEDVVLSLDPQGNVITANQTSKALFQHFQGRPLEPGASFLAMSPELLVQFHQALEGQRIRSEVHSTLGGQTFTLDVTLNPVMEGGKVVGVTLFSRDITQRKEAEARLAELHRNLVDVSRHAGMAEIATGVLHNVGNTLNSVNISTSLLADQLHKSRVSSLARVATLLREHAQDPEVFFSTEQGRKLPGYLLALSDELGKEREVLLKEVRALSESVDHIKSIVSMQQKHARAAGTVDQVPVPQLIDEALRLHAVAFDRLGIRIEREYDEVPPILVDRHKLLQILVNLLSNARHALIDSAQEDKRLCIQVRSLGERLTISLVDNGVGIAPENLARLFSQGFTTKKTGHGFGLHISALAATEMRGALRCESPGPGQGATFTLELPVRGEETQS
jgi:PAS domain S-box-containing protein